MLLLILFENVTRWLVQFWAVYMNENFAQKHNELAQVGSNFCQIIRNCQKFGALVKFTQI